MLNGSDELVSAMKFYCANHLLDSYANGLKGVFLVPTEMSRIFAQAEGAGTDYSIQTADCLPYFWQNPPFIQVIRGCRLDRN